MNYINEILIVTVGEANRAWNTAMYNCTFPEKINDWRNKWNGGFVPYGFVQLANFVTNGGVNIRWHQTADYGYRYKQIVGERLSISGGNVAYGLSTPTNGPFPLEGWFLYLIISY